MALQLDDSPAFYGEFLGLYHKQMPQLIAEGRTPLTVADVMRRRLEVAGSNDPALRSAWLDNYFETSDAVVYHPTKRIKIVRDAQPLRAIQPQSEIYRGALSIDDALYCALAGPEVAMDEIISNTSLTKEQVLASPVWMALVGDDRSLLGAYTDLVFSDAKQRFGYTENMGVYLTLAPATPSARAWSIYRIGNKSDLCGHYDLNCGDSRLVCVASAATRTR